MAWEKLACALFLFAGCAEILVSEQNNFCRQLDKCSQLARCKVLPNGSSLAEVNLTDQLTFLDTSISWADHEEFVDLLAAIKVTRSLVVLVAPKGQPICGDQFRELSKAKKVRYIRKFVICIGEDGALKVIHDTQYGTVQGSSTDEYHSIISMGLTNKSHETFHLELKQNTDEVIRCGNKCKRTCEFPFDLDSWLKIYNADPDVACQECNSTIINTMQFKDFRDKAEMEQIQRFWVDYSIMPTIIMNVIALLALVLDLRSTEPRNYWLFIERIGFLVVSTRLIFFLMYPSLSHETGYKPIKFLTWCLPLVEDVVLLYVPALDGILGLGTRVAVLVGYASIIVLCTCIAFLEQTNHLTQQYMLSIRLFVGGLVVVLSASSLVMGRVELSARPFVLLVPFVIRVAWLVQTSAIQNGSAMLCMVIFSMTAPLLDLYTARVMTNKN